MTRARDTALVSVILTTYNGERFLREQLDSLCRQTYPSVEIIAVDDRSTDGTMTILRQYEKQYPFIKVFQNETNLGFVKNFERGCSLAGGGYLAFCDQDDYWQPQKIEKLVRAIGASPMIYHDSELVNENGESTGLTLSDRVPGMPITNPLQQAVFGRIYGHTILITRALAQKAIPFFEVITHDWWVSYLATLNGGIAYLPDVLVQYRQHTANIYGAIGGKSRERKDKQGKKAKKIKAIADARARVGTFYTLCPESMVREKEILGRLQQCYASFSLRNNWRRMLLFFRYSNELLAVKKRSPLRKYLFCLKMFFTLK